MLLVRNTGYSFILVFFSFIRLCDIRLIALDTKERFDLLLVYTYDHRNSKYLNALIIPVRYLSYFVWP